MKQRNAFAVLALAIIMGLTGALDVNAQFRRRDIYDPFYSAADRHRLRTLIVQWLSALPLTNPANPVTQHLNVIGPLPTGVHCKTASFLTWHRQYIEQLETWLMGQQDGPKFVPLPKWNPTTQIPAEFFNTAVPPGSAVWGGSIFSQNPGVGNFARFLDPNSICNYAAGVEERFCMGVPGTVFTFGSALDNLGRDLELEHNPVHGAVGGVMGQGDSPRAAIFWLWHAYVDDLYQHYLCHCTNNYPDKDLYIIDNDADIGDEPNTTTGVYYLSPDIWVRQNPDVQVGGRYSLEDNPNRHENAEYKIAGNNYVYVRVRNKGCQPTVTNEVRLRVYWSKAQTSNWIWDADWTNNPPQNPKRGDEITNPGVPLWVPPLQPGQTWVAQVPWQAPNPADYPNDSYHFCLLARLVSASDPMAQTETQDVGYNTRENNNIAWKNVTVKNDDPFNIVGPGGHPWNTVHVRGRKGVESPIRIAFDYLRDHGMYATVDLRGDMYKRWIAAGAKGEGITRVGETYVRIDQPGAYIELPPDGDVIYTLGVRPYVEYARNYDGKILNYGDRLNFNVMQYERDSKGTYTATGGNNYEIRLKQSDATNCGELIGSKYMITYPTCPNSTNGAIQLRLPDTWEYFWSTGSHASSISGLPPGTYWVVVRNPEGCVQRREFVLNDLSNLVTSITASYPRCEYSNGSATVAVTGGKKPYTYQWYRNGTKIEGATSATLDNIGFGEYKVEVTDAGGCKITDGINFVDDFMQLGLSFNVTNASRDDAADGAINLTVQDGMGPYTFRWSNGATTEDIRHLTPGDYSVMVVDHMGCVASGTVTVGVSPTKNLSAEGELATALSIIAVVPNPVNDLAEVQYTLNYATNVKAEVYDELGRLVATYDQGTKAPGAGSVWLPTSGLAAGRYQCRLVYRGGVSAIPFVVVR